MYILETDAILDVDLGDALIWVFGRGNFGLAVNYRLYFIALL